MTFADLGVPPDNVVKKALYNFASASNWDDLHSSDWDRFYRFVILAFQKDEGWHWADVRQQLRDYGMPEALAVELSRAYQHALLTLKTFSDGSDKIARLRGGAI